MAGALDEHRRIIESSIATGARSSALLFIMRRNEYCPGSCHVLREGIQVFNPNIETQTLEAKLKIMTVVAT